MKCHKNIKHDGHLGLHLRANQNYIGDEKRCNKKMEFGGSIGPHFRGLEEH